MSWRRLRTLLQATLVLLATMVPACAEAFIEDTFSMSPDGRAFTFVFKSSNVRGAGLVEWQTGRLSRVPGWPGSFSYDGRKLASSTSQGLVILDVRSMQIERVVPDSLHLFAPVFQPGDKAVLCQQDADLVLVDIATGRRQSILGDREGFRTIYSPTFLSPDDILFNGMTPESDALGAMLKAKGLDPIGSMVPYRLRLGGKPQISYEDIITRHLSPVSGRTGSNTDSGFVAGRHGDRILFVGRNDAAERQLNNGYMYDLFLIERGHVSQVTNFAGLLNGPGISYDGSTAIVGLYTRPRSELTYGLRGARPPDEPRIINLDTRSVVDPHLIERVQRDPNFN